MFLTVLMLLATLPVWPVKLDPGVWPEAEFYSRKGELESLAKALSLDFYTDFRQAWKDGDAAPVYERYTHQVCAKFGTVSQYRSLLLGNFGTKTTRTWSFSSKIREGLPHLAYAAGTKQAYVTPENLSDLRALARRMEGGRQ